MECSAIDFQRQHQHYRLLIHRSQSRCYRQHLHDVRAPYDLQLEPQHFVSEAHGMSRHYQKTHKSYATHPNRIANSVPILTALQVRSQRPIGPHKIPPLPPPHKSTNTPAVHRDCLLAPCHTAKLHLEPRIRAPPILCVRRTCAPRPHGARPSRCLRLAGRLQLVAPERRRGRCEPPRRSGWREYGRLDTCQ